MSIDSKRKPNVLTNSTESFRCMTEILGMQFDVEVYLTAEGDLNLAVDGNDKIEEVAKVIGNKCQTPVEAVLPLLVVNLAVLYQNNIKSLEIINNLKDFRDRPIADSLEVKATIH